MSFISILAPIFFVFGVGYISQKLLKFDTAIFSKLALYVLVPFLVFKTFYEEPIDYSYIYISLYMLGLCFIIILIVSVLSKIYRYSESERCGLILSCAFMNNGNYGTPLVLFLFGAVGMETAIVLMVLQQLLMSTLGVYYAAKGGENSNGAKAAARSIRKMPMVYGAILGITFHFFAIPLGSLKEAVDLIGETAIPLIMITLGMQLANIRIGSVNYKKLSTALIVKLIAAPIIAALIVGWMPIETLTKQIMIIMAATPTAANTTMYAIQFQTEPQSVSTSTLATTLMSIVTVPVVIFLVSAY